MRSLKFKDKKGSAEYKDDMRSSKFKDKKGSSQLKALSGVIKIFA